MNMIFKSCPICNNIDIPLLKGFQYLHLAKCSNCSFIFDKRIPTQEELNEYYKYYAYSKLRPLSSFTKASYNKLLDKFEPFKKSGNLLDIGCGQGDFLIEAKKRGWNVYGSEYSKSAVLLCEDRGIEMYQGELNCNAFKGLTFDVITSFEVIEHINNHNKFMQLSNQLLTYGGLLYCTTPNFNSILRNFEKDKFKIIKYPEHISFFTKKSIKYLGKTHGFSISKLLTTGLDLSRIKSLFKKNDEETNIKDRMIATQNIQKLAESNLFMKLVKNVVNIILSIFGKGDTLKVFWIKK